MKVLMAVSMVVAGLVIAGVSFADQPSGSSPVMTSSAGTDRGAWDGSDDLFASTRVGLPGNVPPTAPDDDLSSFAIALIVAGGILSVGGAAFTLRRVSRSRRQAVA